MKVNVFDERIAKDYNRWYVENYKIDKLEKDLILKLIKPNYGDTLLDIGCGCGWHIKWFKDLGLKPQGIDVSSYMVEEAKRFLSKEIEIKVMDAKSLEFSDSSFDIVTLITVLEFVDDPLLVLKEAIRVSKRKIFLGILNKHSWLGLKRRIEAFFKESIYRYARFYSVGEVLNLIELTDKYSQVKWETVIPWPPSKNYFGGFIGVLVNL